MWPSSSTPKNSILNIKTNIQRKNQIWVRIPKSNEKNTWINSIALAHFLLLCAFSNSSVPLLLPLKTSPILQYVLLHKESPPLILKKLSPSFPFLFLFSLLCTFPSDHQRILIAPSCLPLENPQNLALLSIYLSVHGDCISLKNLFCMEVSIYSSMGSNLFLFLMAVSSIYAWWR